MGMPVLVRHHWTREEVLAIPDDGKRREVVDGELLVSPSPRRRHQLGVIGLFRRVDRYVLANRIGTTMLSPANLDLCSGQLVQPDLFVENHRDGRRVQEWSEVGIPLLIVEVLSPTTADYDRGIKRRLYQSSGVPVYWVVDLDARQVEVWQPGADLPEVVRDRLVWQPDPGVAPLAINLPDYFREVWG